MELTLSPLRPTGLGSIPSQRIAGKRPLINPSTGPPKPPLFWTSIGDETQWLYHEANILYWAMALLDFTYRYVDQCIIDAKDLPPFVVPCLCFVEASLLFAYSADCTEAPRIPGCKPGSVGTTYLVEEIIDDEFFKYIHNGSASPVQLTNVEANKVAEFLAFTQHVQYTKTGGQVYISDYQGG
ncbi:hypothetical protein L210DRAFT_3417461 [Boletus edulis BED1]|uniref:Alpha-type protein kinase domain-containing protein n=1 Tax=Boletus edulis BED1 TaxID=1328754 RepID=A0AAD4BHS0_BOLED|nr:hypothetical protein L210DRAFT_3417461 [Boletus edulis BED1]